VTGALALGTRGAAMSMGHACVFAYSMSFEGPMLGGNTVNVHGTVTALSCNVFVQRIPGYSLDIMRVLSNFVYTFTYIMLIFNL
jgi:hypothetical protein